MDIIHNTFTDLNGRTIDVGINFIGNIVAEDKEQVIATWEFDVRRKDDKDFLAAIDIDKGYDNAEIREQMLLAAEEHFSDFVIVERLKEEVAVFFNNCRVRGISKFDHSPFKDDR